MPRSSTQEATFFLHVELQAAQNVQSKKRASLLSYILKFYNLFKCLADRILALKLQTIVRTLKLQSVAELNPRARETQNFNSIQSRFKGILVGGVGKL